MNQGKYVRDMFHRMKSQQGIVRGKEHPVVCKLCEAIPESEN
jgi:hypothetical protein